MLNDALEKSFKVLQTIWIFMLVSVGIYVIICNLLEGKLEVMNENSSMPVELIRNILLGISIAELLGVKFLKKKAHGSKAGHDQGRGRSEVYGSINNIFCNM